MKKKTFPNASSVIATVHKSEELARMLRRKKPVRFGEDEVRWLEFDTIQDPLPVRVAMHNGGL